MQVYRTGLQHCNSKGNSTRQQNPDSQIIPEMMDLVAAPWTAMACMGPEFWYMALEVREMAPNLDTVGRSPKGMRSSSPVSAARRCMSSRCSRMALLSTFWTRHGKGTQKLIHKGTGSHSFYNLVSALSFSHILYSLHFSTHFPILHFLTPLSEGTSPSWSTLRWPLLHHSEKAAKLWSNPEEESSSKWKLRQRKSKWEGEKNHPSYINSKKRSVGISEEYIFLLESKRNVSDAQRWEFYHLRAC